MKIILKNLIHNGRILLTISLMDYKPQSLVRFPDYEKDCLKIDNFLQSFEDTNGQLPYQNQLRAIAERQRYVLEIFLDDVLNHKQDEEFCRSIQKNTLRYALLFELAADKNLPEPAENAADPDVFDNLSDQRLRSLQRNSVGFGVGPEGDSTGAAATVSIDLPASLLRRFEVCIIPLTSDLSRKIREIKAFDIGSLVKINGMVIRATDVKPQVAVVTYTCDMCGSDLFQEVGGTQFMPLSKCSSQSCRDNNVSGKLQMQSRGSKFSKYQELKIQELPNQVPVGHIPRCMVVQCHGETTRSCGPGDIITISGIFLALKLEGFKAMKSGLQADTYIRASKIEKSKQSYSALSSTTDARRLVEEIAQDQDPYSRLASSIAPEIFGHDDVKKALLLQLVGGVSKSLPDGMKIRGDLNVLLMGDPGVAKSQLLKYIASVAPRGVYTTGKGSSGVGLTASVVRDIISGDMQLEGGALVMADRGICCIDEFDKMEDSDRTAIHEVMEQQTVSIAKAGITTTLNARAAVLAAANPLYGRYNVKKSIAENVDLPNSLLSRFDLLFLILDRASMDSDLALSRHVLHVHKYRRKPDQEREALDPSTIKQYIAAARSFEPVIPKQVTNHIVESYVSLRTQDSPDTSARKNSYYQQKDNDQAAMTARQLLSILRLSQSLARLRLANEVAMEDIDEAIRLTHASKASLYDESPSKPTEDSMSLIFSAMRDLATSQNNSSLNYSTVVNVVLRKGFTEQQLRSCLDEYENLGVLSVDEDRTAIEIH